jgi:hypothetical protein
MSGMFPSRYKLVRKAGDGTSAEVYFCLTDDIINAAKAAGPLTTDSPGFEDRLTTLRKSLVAIKIIREDLDREEDSNSEMSGEQYIEDDPIIKEYNLLKLIHSSTLPGAATAKKHFLSPIGHGMRGPRGRDSWLAVPAVEPSVSLGDLLKVSKENDLKLPTSLAFHVFASLTPSLLFLREQLQWTPNDVKDFNVLCKFTSESPLGLPECVFIDMGMALEWDQQTDTSDCVDLLQLVKDFADRTVMSTDKDWIAFRGMLDDNADYCLRKKTASILGNIWTTWKSVAEEGMRKRTEDDKVVLEDLLESVIAQKKKEGIGRVAEEDLIQAVDRHFWAIQYI